MRRVGRSPHLASPLPRLLVVMTTAARVAAPTLAVRRDGPDAVVLEIAGAWLSECGLPKPADALAELRSGAVHHLSFDASRITEWHSGLVTFVLNALSQAAKSDIDTDRAGLPDGAQRLGALAQAVPRRQTGRHHTRPPWLARLRPGAIR